MRTIGLLLLASLLGSMQATAQSAPTGFRREMLATATLRPAAPAVSAELGATPAGFDATRRFTSRAPGATLMIIGASALVAGILVGGDAGTLLIIGGIGVGAYGVYLFTR